MNIMREGKVINHLMNKVFRFKGVCFESESFLVRLWSTAKRGNRSTGFRSNLNALKYCTAHPNVRDLGAFSPKKDNDILHRSGAGGLFGLDKEKTFLYMLNRRALDTDFPNSRSILKFELLRALIENLKNSRKLLSLTQKALSQEDIEKQWGGSEAYKLITFIKDDFNEVVNKHPVVIVFFSAEWCHHCLRLRAHYGTAALMAKEANLPAVFATFDVTTNPDIADEQGVIGIPTVKYYKNGKVISTFRGKRSADDLFDYAKNPQTPGPVDTKKADF